MAGSGGWIIRPDEHQQATGRSGAIWLNHPRDWGDHHRMCAEPVATALGWLQTVPRALCWLVRAAAVAARRLLPAGRPASGRASRAFRARARTLDSGATRLLWARLVQAARHLGRRRKQWHLLGCWLREVKPRGQED